MKTSDPIVQSEVDRIIESIRGEYSKRVKHPIVFDTIVNLERWRLEREVLESMKGESVDEP